MRVYNRSDIQANILRGLGGSKPPRGNYPCALYLFSKVKDEQSARRWLAEQLAREAITSDRTTPPPATLNVAFTHAGLKAIGVPDRVVCTFPDTFKEGMAESCEELGDDRKQFEDGLLGAHVLLTVLTVDENTRGRREPELTKELKASGFEPLKAQRADVLEGLREPFGFRDGIAQPQPDLTPLGGPPPPNGKRVALGEFVLGYDDEGGGKPGEPAEIGHNGTFMVVRKLEQDVDGFAKYLRKHSGGDPEREERLAAKLLGRRRDGTPLVHVPGPSPPAEGEPANNFGYAHDEHGRQCPLGAHIRRANPRDGLDPEGIFSKRHRILRRGVPYAEDGRQGLMFVCLQASIARQFEFIQCEWLNDGETLGLGDDPDLTSPADGKMVIQGSPPDLVEIHQFVTCRGGDYFFAPGLRALGKIARGMR